MRTFVPYSPVDPKSRLTRLLSREERHAFARAMLEDVVETVTGAGYSPTILAAAAVNDPPCDVLIDDRPLSAAVNATLEPPMAVVMSDMPLVTSNVLGDALERSSDVVIGPGRGGGTNLLVIRDERFAVDYHGTSLSDHRRIAADAGLSVDELDSFRIAIDIDEPEDLVEVLLHSEGDAARWLEQAGFDIVATDGRVSVQRS